MSRSSISRTRAEFSFKTAWLVWEYDYDYGPEDSDQYFCVSSSKVFLNEKDAKLYAKQHGDMEVDEIQCAV